MRENETSGWDNEVQIPFIMRVFLKQESFITTSTYPTLLMDENQWNGGKPVQ